MSNLDGVINKAKDIMNIAGKKTGDIFEISKLKIDKMNKSAELQKNYELLGKMFYLEYKSTDIQPDNINIKEIINTIERLESDIKNIDNNIFNMKNIKTCKKCGHKNNKKSLYCSLCGEQLYPHEDINNEQKDITININESNIDEPSVVIESDIDPNFNANPDQQENNISELND